jgi:hypothetical protein
VVNRNLDVGVFCRTKLRQVNLTATDTGMPWFLSLMVGCAEFCAKNNVFGKSRLDFDKPEDWFATTGKP